MGLLNDFVNTIGGAAQAAGKDIQQGAADVYNVLPYWMQQAGVGSTLKAVSGNNQTQDKPVPESFSKMTNSLGYKLASGFAGADIENPEAIGNLVGKASQLYRRPELPADTSFMSRGQPVKVSPEVQASMNYHPTPTQARPTIEGVPSQPRPSLPAQPPKFPQANLKPLVNQTLPKVAKPNILIKMGNAIKSDVGKVKAPDASSSLYGPEHTANIQDALVRNHVDNYNQLPQAARNLYDNVINPELSSNPQFIKLDDVTNKIVHEMKKMSPELNDGEAKTAAHTVINNLYNVTRNAQGNVQPIPDFVDTPTLFNIRQGLNDTMAVDKFFNGTPLSNSNEIATVAGRNALSNLISDAHPAISQATKDYGLLKDAVPSLYKASQQGRGIGLNLPIGSNGINIGLPSAIGGPVRDIAGGALRGAGKVADTPIGKAVGLTSLVGGGTALGMSGLPQTIANELIGKNHANAGQPGGGVGDNSFGQVHNGDISQSFTNYKADPKTGHFELPTTPSDPNQKYMSQQDYQNALAAIGNQYTYGTPAYNNAKAQLDAQHEGDKERAKLVFNGNNLMNFMSNAQTYNSDGKVLQDTLSSLPLGFWNGVSKAGSIRAYNDPNYAQELQQIQSFNNEFTSAYKAVTGEEPGKDQLLDSANSPDQAAKKYAAMMQWISGNYAKYKSPYDALTSGSGTTTNLGTPQGVVAPAQQGPTDTNLGPGMVQGGPIPSLNTPPINTPNLPPLVSPVAP